MGIAARLGGSESRCPDLYISRPDSHGGIGSSTSDGSSSVLHNLAAQGGALTEHHTIAGAVEAIEIERIAAGVSVTAPAVQVNACAW